MNVDVSVNIRDEAMLEGVRLDRRRHLVLRPGKWVGHVQRRFPKHKLFLYFHRETRRFVLAEIIHGKDIMIDLEQFPCPPDKLPSQYLPSLPMLWMRLRPAETVYREIQAQLRTVAKERREETVANAEEKKEAQRWLRKHGHHDIAAVMDYQPYCGETAGGERLQEARQRLCQIAKAAS
jgi:hypothetical protein